MQPTRFAHPNYNQHQMQWTPGKPRFGPRGLMLHRSRPGNYFSKEPNTFKSANVEHWCETCDRGFPNIQLLENHKQQHQKCNIDGCQFIAHPKVITKHIQMQHSTGLYKKISKLDNPEEIKKWREERKRRYPTKENIEKKSAEIKEKIDRGEKMAMKHNRENKSFRTDLGTKRKYGNENNHGQRFVNNFKTTEALTINKNKKVKQEVSNKTKPQVINKIIPSEDDSRTLKPFAGILHLIDDINSENMEEPQNSDSIEDDEYTLDDYSRTHNSTPAEPLVCGALSLLMCSYEYSDDELEIVTDVKNNKPTESFNKQKNTSQDKSPISNECVKNTTISKSDDDSGPEEIKIVKHIDVVSNTEVPNNAVKEYSNNENHKKTDKRIKNDNIHNRKNPKRFKPKLPSTLLEKLLHNEIRQERNIVLQCIRYIVNNNYFDKTVKNN